MSIELASTNPGASDAAISALEAHIGAPLPAPYRAFLAANDGAHASANVFDFPGGDADADVNSFYSLAEIADTRGIVDFDPPISRIPDGMLPIAYTSVGDWIAIDLAAGSIWFVDHELTPEEPTGVIEVAPDFDAFLSNLRAPDPSTLVLPEDAAEIVGFHTEWAGQHPELFTDEFKANNPAIFNAPPPPKPRLGFGRRR